MKKKICLFLLVAVLTAISGQAQFKVGARAGFNLSNINFDYPKILSEIPEIEVSYNYKLLPGFQVGIVGDYSLSEDFSIQSSILFTMMGAKLEHYVKSEIEEEGFIMKLNTETKGTLRINYIQVPVNALYKFDVGSIKLLAQAGPYFGYGLGVNLEYESTSSTYIKIGEFEESSFNQESDNKKYKMGSGKDKYYTAFDFGLGVGVGAQFGNIQVNLVYNHGFSNMVNKNLTEIEGEPVDDEDRQQIRDLNYRNRCFAFTLTYLFGK